MPHPLGFTDPWTFTQPNFMQSDYWVSNAALTSRLWTLALVQVETMGPGVVGKGPPPKKIEQQSTSTAPS